MTETSRGAIGWPWVLGAVLIVFLGAVVCLTSSDDGDSTWGEPEDELAHRGEPPPVASAPYRPERRDPRGQAPSPVPSSAPSKGRAPEVRSGPMEARIIADGGGTAAEPAEPERRHPGPPEAPVRIAPTPPETKLRRAEFVRDLLDRRIDEMRREREVAREAGDEGRVRRTERAIERMEAQRPGIEQRVRELRREL